MYTPDGWVIIKVTDSDYKVFGSWTGNFTKGDSWRVNSGIDSVIEDGEYIRFIGYSGSEYLCHKNTEGQLTIYNKGVLSHFIEATKGVSIIDYKEFKCLGSN